MAKIDIEKIKHILHRNESDIQKINDILNDIAMELEIEQAEKEARPPAVKKQFITLIADNNGVLVDQDFASWVLQIPEEANPQAVIDKIHQSAYTYNATPKGSRFPVKSMGETLESVSAKIFKENEVWVKTKIPVLAVSCKNQIPQS